MSDRSLAEKYALLPPEKRKNLLRQLAPEEARELLGCWRFWARPKQIAPEGDWSVWMMRVGRGGGKELALETPIPTPDGWTTMGDICVGDLVFDEAGRRCRVTGKHYPKPNKQYELTFSDGSVIKCGADHQWVTWEHLDRKAWTRRGNKSPPPDWPTWEHCGSKGLPRGPKTRSTKDIINTFSYGGRGDTNHSIPVCGFLRLPEVSLPYDPWLLGYWLGNGSSRDTTICGHLHDLDEVSGRATLRCVRTGQRDRLVFVARVDSLKGVHSLCPDKMVPTEYLRSSAVQRLELLRGLMDSDGYHGGKDVEFCNTRKHLAEAVFELAASLGQKPRISEGRAMLYGKDCGPKYRVNWTPTVSVFSFKRKNKDRAGLGQAHRHHHRMIVSYREIEVLEQMACIEVDSLNCMYLIGRAMIPTHNTRAGSGWVNERAQEYPGRWIALVAATMADARDVMIEGPSGIIRTAPHDFQPVYEPSKRRITWPNGSWATVYSDEDPDQLRGFSGDTAWLDELGKYKHPRETWENLRFGMRESSTDRPRTLITTTPRPDPIFKEIENKESTVTIVGSSYENRANLDPTWFRETIEGYEGTRIGRQEIHAEILDDVPGALWTRRGLDESRIREAPALARVVIGVDPAITSGDSSNETGIIVSGVDARGHGYVIEDATLKGSPDKWARMAVAMYRKHEADCIVAESNQGGEMVKHTLRTIDPNLPIKLVHATRGKYIRAEPIAALYEAGRVSHVGVLTKLEDQMISFTPEMAAARTSRDSPDRCFVAGTMIETESGPIAIQLIRPGDMVWTRAGLRLVVASELTNENAETIEIELTNGERLRGTRNHPIFTDRGWIDMGSLTCKDRLFHIGELEWQRESVQNSTERSISVTQEAQAGPAGHIFMHGIIRRFTGMFGLWHTEKSPRGATFTTSTGIHQTILSTILRWLPPRSMERFIGIPRHKNTKNATKNIWTEYAFSPKNGTPAREGTGGTRNTAKPFSLISKFLKRLARNVVSGLMLGRALQCFALAPVATELMTERRDIALTVNARFVASNLGQGRIATKEPVRVHAVERCSGAPVYNLRVAGTNEYFANGILVHNCDALIWSLHELFPSILTKRVEDEQDDYPFRRKGGEYEERNATTGY